MGINTFITPATLKGWQQNFDTVGKYTSNQTTGTGHPCNKTSCGINGTIYQQETSLAQMASRFAAFCEFSPPNPSRQVQGKFVYRHMEVAEYYWSIAAAAFHDPGNAEMFLHSEEGKICWKTNDMTGKYSLSSLSHHPVTLPPTTPPPSRAWLIPRPGTPPTGTCMTRSTVLTAAFLR
jgi:hypothetical protein